MAKVGARLNEKASAFKHAISSREAFVKYLEAPLLEGDEDTSESRRVRVEWEACLDISANDLVSLVDKSRSRKLASPR